MEINESTILEDLRNLRKHVTDDDHFQNLKEVYLKRSEQEAMKGLVYKEMNVALGKIQSLGISKWDSKDCIKSYFSNDPWSKIYG